MIPTSNIAIWPTSELKACQLPPCVSAHSLFNNHKKHDRAIRCEVGSWASAMWVCPVQCTMCPVQCTMCPVLCTMCPIQCTMCPVLCTMCPVQCAMCMWYNVGLPCHPSQSPAAESLLIRGFNHPAGKSSLFTDNSRLYSPPWKVKRSSKLGWTFLNLPWLPLMNSIKNQTVDNIDQDQHQSTKHGKDHILLFDTPGHGLNRPCEALFLVSG